MVQVLQDLADMAVDFKRPHGYSLLTFNIQYVSSENLSSSVNSTRKTQMLALPGRTLQKGLPNNL